MIHQNPHDSRGVWGAVEDGGGDNLLQIPRQDIEQTYGISMEMESLLSPGLSNLFIEEFEEKNLCLSHR